jgi:hypothetical protein
LTGLLRYPSRSLDGRSRTIPEQQSKPRRRWKPKHDRINPVTVRLRFDDDDGTDAAAAFAFERYIEHYWRGEMEEALTALADLHDLAGELLMLTAEEAKAYAGLTWSEIGTATGTSGQAAWQKWSRGRSRARDPISAIAGRAKREALRQGAPQESVAE